MRIFCTSDIWGRKSIMNKLKIVAKDVDLILIAGDVASKIRVPVIDLKPFQDEDIRYLNQVGHAITEGEQTGFAYILGNDWTDYCPEDGFELKKPVSVEVTEGLSCTDSIWMYPFPFASLSGLNGNREVNENRMSYELNKLTTGDPVIKTGKNPNTVILGLMPPRGCVDELLEIHTGSLAIRDFLERTQPAAYFCGHAPESFGVAKICDTVVFNCACDLKDELRGWIFDTKTQNYEEVHI